MADTIRKAADLSSLTVLEAAELAKMLEEKWGATAAATGAVDAVAAHEEQTEFTVVLTSAGDKENEVIKEVRAITGLGLKEARDLVEAAPTVVKEGVSRNEATREHEQLFAVGAQVLLVRTSSNGLRNAITINKISRRSSAETDLKVAPKSHSGEDAVDMDRRPIVDFRREAEIIGVPIEPQRNRSEATVIVWKIADDARDLFPSRSAAQTFLFDHPIDDSGRTAVDLVQERGAAALLIKLDQMRFGANG